MQTVQPGISVPSSALRPGESTQKLISINELTLNYYDPLQDTYGVIETPENSGLIPAADTAIVPALPSDNSTARSRPNGNP